LSKVGSKTEKALPGVREKKRGLRPKGGKHTLK